MKKKNILLPTDFSVNAHHAINYAIRLFERVPCTFHILNAFEASPSRLGSRRGHSKDTRLFRAIKSESKRNIQAIISELQLAHANPLHKLEGYSIPETLLNAIGRITIDKDIDFIFMGTKGSSALKEIFIGSSTIQVLQNIDFCPIVAVPSDYTIAPPAVIAFATNFEHIYTKGELAPLIELARLSAADIAIIHVDKGDGLSESQEAVKEALVKKFKGIPSRFQEVVGQSRISEAIMSFAVENEDVGLVAMINYWHSFLDKLTRENVIRQVAFHTEVPMLIFHFIKPS